MSEEEKKAIEYFKKSFISKTPPYWYDDTIENSEIKIKTLVNLIEKLKKENQELRNTKNNCPQFNTSGIKCKNKDIHCPTSKETLDYYENFLIPGYEEEIKKLKKENEELKNKVVKRDNEIIQLEESAEKEFLTKQEVKENYIQKAKIKEKLEELENEEKALRKDFEKHRVQLFELYKKVVLIEGYKKLLEEE